MNVLIIGNGISGLSCAIEAASLGHHVVIASEVDAERTQSVMAAGGINASMNLFNDGDNPEIYANDTFVGGCCIENKEAINNFCSMSKENIEWLSSVGVIFSKDENNNYKIRSLGGHSKKRSFFSGTSTGKQIMTALTNRCIKYIKEGIMEFKNNHYFYSALINNNCCNGALFIDRFSGKLTPIYADSIVFATGGPNKLFGKTTGTIFNDGYAQGKLFTQGVNLRNLEFIQYHPTSIETEHKRMLISEAARGEGGRLFYEKDGKRIYFMEDLFGTKGNLMPRDVCAREIYKIKEQVYLDITFLGEKKIHSNLEEVYKSCLDYIGLDCTKNPIPVAPCIHFFMGGIKVNNNHETNINNLFAVGECASKYHGANRLGGNSLMAAIYSGRVAARNIKENHQSFDYSEYISSEQSKIDDLKNSKSLFPSVYLLKDLSKLMNSSLGIVRSQELMETGVKALNYDLQVVENLKFDPSVNIYDNISIKYMMILAKATLLSALERKESRGSHYRSDYPELSSDYQKVSVASYNNGNIMINMEAENDY